MGAQVAGPAPRIAENFITLLLGDLASKLLRFLAAIALARTLTLEGFGLVNAAIAVSGVAAVLTTVGLTDIGARDVAVAPRTIQAVASRVVTVRLYTILVTLAGSAAVALVIDPEYLDLVLAGGAMAVGMAVSGEWALRGLERMRRLAFASMAGALTVAIGALLIALLGGGPVIALCAFAVGEAVLAAATWVGVGRAGWPRPTLVGAGAMLRRSWPVGAASLIVYSYYANVDTIILAAVRSPAEAGLYSAPYRMFLMLNVVAVFAAYAAFPTLSRASDAALDSDARLLLTRILELLLCYGLLVVGCVHIFGGAALGWLFGSQFETMETTFALLSLAVAWYSIGYPAGYSLIADRKNKRFLAGAATAGALSLALNLTLIPPYGAEGAGAATAIAFAAASLVWLRARGLLVGVGWLMVAALGSLSAAVGVADVANARTELGIVAVISSCAGFGWIAWRRRTRDNN